jgi:hypothetical protein
VGGTAGQPAAEQTPGVGVGVCVLVGTGAEGGGKGVSCVEHIDRLRLGRRGVCTCVCVWGGGPTVAQRYGVLCVSACWYPLADGTRTSSQQPVRNLLTLLLLLLLLLLSDGACCELVSACCVRVTA